MGNKYKQVHETQYELPADWTKGSLFYPFNQLERVIGKIVSCTSFRCDHFKPYHNWLNKGTFRDMNQSKIMLESLYV